MGGKRIVYTSETGDSRGHRVDPDRESQNSVGHRDDGLSPPADGNNIKVVVRLERSGRKGKAVTVATGFPWPASRLQALAKELRRMCGTGGTARDETIELQGDHRDAVVEALGSRGFKATRGN